MNPRRERLEPVEDRPRTRRRARHPQFVVTVRMDHFVVVKAPDADSARRRGLDTARSQWGAGLRPEVTEVEPL